MFYVGQKVVCVDSRSTNSAGNPEISEGRVYTVARIHPSATPFAIPETPAQHARGISLDLQEVPGRGVPFAATRFRPVVERKTDISIFTDMLKPKHVEVQA